MGEERDSAPKGADSGGKAQDKAAADSGARRETDAGRPAPEKQAAKKNAAALAAALRANLARRKARDRAAKPTPPGGGGDRDSEG